MRTGSTHCVSCGHKLREDDAAKPTKHPKMFTCDDAKCAEMARDLFSLALGGKLMENLSGENE